MSDYLSTENLTKIGERADAATKGPWYLAEDNGIIQSREVAVQVGPYSYEVVGIVPYEHVRPNDAEFIAAAREDVPALLAHVGQQAVILQRATQLIAELADPGACEFDHHGGCQAHGYLELQPGETCPQADAAEWAAALDGAGA